MKSIILALLLVTSSAYAEDVEIIKTDKIAVYANTDSYIESKAAGAMIYKVIDFTDKSITEVGVIVNRAECIAKYAGTVRLLDTQGEVTEHKWNGADLKNILDFQAMLVCDVIKSRVRKTNVNL